MRHINNILVITLLVMLGLTACSNQLDIEQMGNKGSEENFYKTDDDAESAITACYADLGNEDLYGVVKCVDDLLSDDVWCGGGQRNDNAQREDLGSFTFGPTNELIQSMYEALYTLIYHANLVIEKFDTYDTPVKKRDLAEAYFFRGFAHFYLGAYFGTTPVVNHILADGNYNLPNSTREELYAQAANDMKEAINSGSLTKKQGLTDKNVRITETGAKAFLGKVLVFAGQYGEAAQYLNQVVSSGLYRLNTGAYEDLLHAGNDYDPEHIFEWNAVVDYNNMRYGLYYIYRGFRADFYNWNCTDPNISNSAYGFMNPTKDLYDAFVKEEGKDGYRLTQSIKTQSQLAEVGITMAPGKVLHGHEGYWNWKQRLLNTDYYVYGLFSSTNYLWMRYAEVLLLAAEANLQSGNQAEALKDLNQVRERVKLPAKTSITMDDVKTEKRLELWGEGTRWMDLVRWGDAESKLANKGKEMPAFDGSKVFVEYTQTNAGYKANKNEMLPIPDQEIKLNSNMKQNTGY